MITRKIVNPAGRFWHSVPNPFGVNGYTYIEHIFELPSGKIMATGINNGRNCTWYSTDNGKTWSDPVSVASHGDLISTLYIMSTGRMLKGNEAGNCYYSDDGGETWTQALFIDNGPQETIYLFFELPTGRILMGTSKGCYYSDDNGETWTHSHVNNDYDVCFNYYYISHTGRLFAAAPVGPYDHRGLYFSDDNGENWTSKFVQSGEGNINHVSLMFEINNSLALLSEYGMTQSNDDGNTWSTMKYNSDVDNAIMLPNGRIISHTKYRNGLYYSDDACETTNNVHDKINYGIKHFLLLQSGTVLAIPDNNIGPAGSYIYYSDPEVQSKYTSKPLTGKQAKELVQQCKAYVQSLKNGN